MRRLHWSWLVAKVNMQLGWGGCMRIEILSASISKATASGAARKRHWRTGLGNVAFIRSHIDKITDYFTKGEVAEIWITFPDPQLRASRSKKRLTHPKFLRLYQQIMNDNGLINLKTDSPDLYAFTLAVIDVFELEVVEQTDHVYHQESIKPELQIKTHYEGLDIAQSNRIHYVSFRINKVLPVEKDEILKQMFREQDIN
jgi:tRNA (guanine-N7-)-methyltransferase